MKKDHVKTAKFGGSSLADSHQFKKVAEIIRSDPNRCFIVPSAPGKRFKDDKKVTDLLYALHKAASEKQDIEPLFDEIKKRFEEITEGLGMMQFPLDEEFDTIRKNLECGVNADYVASRGEYLNGKILASYLGFDFIDAKDFIFFKEDGSYDEYKTNAVLKGILKGKERAVIPGFYGSTPSDEIETFSRGGSDITGSIVAKASDSELYENWTDVSGFLMADPRVVDSPKPIKVITYRELRELSYMGATVLHEEAIFPVRSAGIPVRIKNTNDPDAEGTLIVAKTDDIDTKNVITGIAGKKNFSVITIEKDLMNSAVGFGADVLEVLRKHNLVFEHLPSGIDTMSVILSSQQLDNYKDVIINELCKVCEPDCISVEDGLALLAVVGRGMVRERGTAARVFGAIAKAGVNIRMIDQGSSELNIIVGIDENDLEKAERAIYAEFVS